ncbi:MAG TPA: 50S ribosomal protein L1 [Candidatus Saccharimonadales bacterium]
MAKTKAELLLEAKELGLDIDKLATIAVIKLRLENSAKPTEIVVTEEVADEAVVTAKAGKRSAKALKEADDLKLKEERKAAGETKDSTKTAIVQTPTRSKLERRGKAFKKAAEKIEANKAYGLEEAIELAKTTSPVKFDASVELHINLNVDPRQADQNIRDNLILPAGNGKKVRVAVFTDDSKAALAAGADIAGNEDFLSQLDKGKMDFDILISTPMLMAKLGKYARTLGPRGLMPNPKSGTVTTDVVKAITEAKGGKVEYRVDSNGIVHIAVGKVSFENAKLNENIDTVLKSIKSNKPQSVKSGYFKAIHLATSMGPSILVDLSAAN